MTPILLFHFSFQYTIKLTFQVVIINYYVSLSKVAVSVLQNHPSPFFFFFLSSLTLCSYPDDIADIVSDLVACQPWPYEADLSDITPVTSSRDHISNSNAGSNRLSPSPPVSLYRPWVPPAERTFEFGSSSASRAGVLHAVLVTLGSVIVSLLLHH